MKLDSLPGEKPILACKLINGNCWITTHRLIIEEEKHNPHFDIMEKQAPEIYLLQNLKKTEIKDGTLKAHFKGRKKAQIQLQQPHTPKQLQEIKDLIEQASEILERASSKKRHE